MSLELIVEKLVIIATTLISYRFKSEEEEPYEEALRIVKAKSSQLPIQHPDI